jgi:hypothetical protein
MAHGMRCEKLDQRFVVPVVPVLAITHKRMESGILKKKKQ